MRIQFWFVALALGLSAEVRAEEKPTRVPRWDARGVGPLPWQGISCLDVNADASRIAIGTIAPAGDPNVLLLDGEGRVIRAQHAGQRWIERVAIGPEEDVLRALCTMPAGKSGDQTELFRLGKDEVAAEGISWRKTSYPEAYFHYGDHSNHVTRLLAGKGPHSVVVNGDQVSWLGTKDVKPVTFSLGHDAIPVCVAVGRTGLVVVGTTGVPAGDKHVPNLHVLQPGQAKPLWARDPVRETDESPRPEKGLYGRPTLPDGTREELPQRDEKVWAPLAVAVHTAAEGRGFRVAVADYQGWQRLVRSSATRQEESLGFRFQPSKPAITVYDEQQKTLRRFGPESLGPMWCDLRFLPDGKRLLAWPHSWTARGLAGQPILPADDEARTLYALDVAAGKVVKRTFPDAIASVDVGESGTVAVSCWDGKVYVLFADRDFEGGPLPAGIAVGGPALVRVTDDGLRIVVATMAGVVRLLRVGGKEVWQTDLNKAVKPGLKPWVANARAMPLAAGVWQLPGGRVESDLGGQRVIEAPDGLILIEAHAGLSFESEWAAMQAVGLDPKRVKYVLATHEHGDHAPGAYLWRVVAGAQFVCSAEMAYTLQHHVPLNSGYGFHPPNPTDVRITEDTDLDLAGLKVRALRIPGHTAGSMAWMFEKGGKKYVSFGDLIMPRGVLGYSGSINFSAADVLASLRKLQAAKPDVVLPGHGAVGGPEDTLGAGVEVAMAGGWGLIKPEKPDPYFRITQKNVVVVAWNREATSAAFGDVDGDGQPDVVTVRRAATGAQVEVFLNKGGKFGEKPDHAIDVPSVERPSKVRVVPGEKGKPATIFVAGSSAALLVPDGKQPGYRIVSIALSDGNHVRILDEGDRKRMLLSSRFGGFQLFERVGDKDHLSPFKPEVRGPYADLQSVDLNGDGRPDLVTSAGRVYLRGADGKLPEKPSLQFQTAADDWTFLAVGDFNGDGKPDIVLLDYGMHGKPAARVFYNKGEAERPFNEKPDAIIPLIPKGKDGGSSLLRDAPVVVDWNGDGIADLVVGWGQSQEVLVLLGGKQGLDRERSQTIALDYRTHYETGLFFGDFDGGRPDLAVFGYTLTGVGWNGPPAAYLWLQPKEKPGTPK
jgi:glyoxylase-like metal-dependent hydrolase (beta-lactamase superfamily II)